MLQKQKLGAKTIRPYSTIVLHCSFYCRRRQHDESDESNDSFDKSNTASTLLPFLATISNEFSSFLVQDAIYTSRAYATMSVSVCLFVRLSVTEVHCGRGACREDGRGHLAQC